MLRVEGAFDLFRLKQVPRDGHVNNDALRMAVSRGSSAKLWHFRVHADTSFRIPGTASNLAASGECNRKRGTHQGSFGGTALGALQNRC